jgi:hypothetical protein
MLIFLLTFTRINLALFYHAPHRGGQTFVAPTGTLLRVIGTFKAKTIRVYKFYYPDTVVTWRWRESTREEHD